MPDVSLGSWLVPGIAVSAAGAVLGAVWSWATQRQLARLQARLEATGRVLEAVHPHRVEAAVALWRETAAFERALDDLLAPFDELTLEEDAPRDLRREAFLRHEERIAKELSGLFPGLMRAAASAECFFAPEGAAAVRGLADAYGAAHGDYWRSRFASDADEKAQARRDARERFADARALRAKLLGHVRALLRSDAV